MKHYKLLGIISSIVLVLNYLLIGPLITLGYKEYWFYKFLLYYRPIIFPLVFIGFYFALLVQIKFYKTPKLTVPVAIILGLGIINFMIGFFQFLGFNYPDFFSSWIMFASVVVLILWTIRIIRNKTMDILKIRRFAVSMLISNIIVFLFVLANMIFMTQIYKSGHQPYQYNNLAYFVYGIGYAFGFLIFIKQEENTSS